MPNKEALGLYRYPENSRLRPSVLKSLIEQGRIPQLDEVEEAWGVERPKRFFYCWVPSADTRLGDITGVFAGSRYFQSPTGELRGKPDFFVLKPSQAARLQERITVFEAEASPKK